MSDERLCDLESTVAFQEKTISELNKVVYEQQQQIDGLEKALHELAERLSTLQGRVDDGGGAPAADERPPHY